MLVMWYNRQAVLFISRLLGEQAFIINSFHSFIVLVYNNSLNAQFLPHYVHGDLLWSKQKWKFSLPFSDSPGIPKLKNEVQYVFQQKATNDFFSWAMTFTKPLGTTQCFKCYTQKGEFFKHKSTFT